MASKTTPSGTGAIVGLDFGMTNSILTYHTTDKSPEPYHLRGASSPAIPTAVFQSPFERFIGRLARLTVGFVGNFKVLLPQAGIDARQRKKNPAFASATTFLEDLFRDFCAEQQVDRVARLVATVPESWLSGREQGGVDTLRAILTGIGIADPQFLSEPVAAAAYFAHRCRVDRPGHDFDGHVLVYDHGGSTLDMALVRIKGALIEVISSVGNSGGPSSTGFGGVAYDRYVMDHITRRDGQAFTGLSDAQKRDWLAEFETAKEEHASRIDARCTNPDFTSLRDKSIFEVKSVAVTLADLLDTFDHHFKAQILADLDRVLADGQSCDDIALTDLSRFRVVSVGGFSQFRPIQDLLRIYFTARCGSEQVLASGIVGRDRWLAVSKGACLVAAGTIEVNRTCPFTFGVVSYVGQQDYVHILMRAGEPVADYRQPRYLHTEFELARFEAKPDARSIVLFLENAGGTMRLPMTHAFDAVLPDFGRALGWNLGCQVVNSSVFLAIKSDTGRTTTVRMGRLLRMAEGRITEAVENWSTA